MNKKGIGIAGNMIVDITYPIDKWPAQGELVTINEGIVRSSGGAVNVLSDLAKIDPSLRLSMYGAIGNDSEGDFLTEELGAYKNVSLDGVRRMGRTSFTAVMSNAAAGMRTFFQYRGANALFDESFIDWSSMNIDILHISYALLLDALDEEDGEYGTKMARLLAHAQKRGIETSIDVVSESGDRFKRVFAPSLKYADYCIINEIEAQNTTGVALRGEDGSFYAKNAKRALERMKEMGVARWAVIHCPEGGFGIDENGGYAELESLKLPKGYIKGTVGAGDAYLSGVLYGAYTGADIGEAMRLGTAAAAASLGSCGASEGMKSREKLVTLYDDIKEGRI